MGKPIVEMDLMSQVSSIMVSYILLRIYYIIPKFRSIHFLIRVLLDYA